MIFNKQILITLFLTLCFIDVMQASILDGRTEPMPKDEAKAFFRNVSKECGFDDLTKVTIHPSDAMAIKLFLRRAKCVMACSLEKIGIINGDNQINKEVVAYISEVLMDNNDHSKTCDDEKFYEKCYDITDPERCEFAFKLGECFQKYCRPEEYRIKNQIKHENLF